MSFNRSILIGLLGFLGVPLALAATPMTMSLQPHCTEAERTTCPRFAVTGPSSISTGKVVAGDILDIDVVVEGDRYKDVRSVRSWLQYDPAILEGRSVELTGALPSPIPGEQRVDPAVSLVKIGGGSETGLPSSNVAVARVTFRVLKTTEDTRISFSGYSPDGIGQTAVNGSRVIRGEDGGLLPAPPCIGSLLGCKGAPEPLLSVEPASLIVLSKDASTLQSSSSSSIPRFQAAASSEGNVTLPPAVAASVPSSVIPQRNTSPSGIGGASAFGILQVQDLKVTTQGTSAFLGWNILGSAEIAGYNVYYGTVSGRYIQRRTVSKEETSLVIRDLQAGTTYYFAVRAFSTNGQESAFSREASVTIGNPGTASSPLNAGLDAIGIQPSKGPMPVNMISSYGGTRVGGDTGLSDIVALVLAASAVVGTGFAFRRQLHLMHHAE